VSKVISSFLVGLGFNVDQKGAKEFEGSIDSVRSKALQLGSVVAGGLGIKALTADFAAGRDMLGKFSETFGVSANNVMAIGNALATEGGTLDGFMSQLENLERARARILVGDVGFFAPAAKAGIDPNTIAEANNATEAYLSLANAFQTMNTQQRLNAAEALGLDESSIRLLSRGRDDVNALVEQFRGIRPVTEESTEAAAKFNREWLKVKQNVGGVTDAIAGPLTMAVANVTEGINSWFSDDQAGRIKKYGDLTKAAFGWINPEEVAESSGLPEWLFKPIDQMILDDDQRTDIGRGIHQALALFGNEESQAALDAEASAGGYTDAYNFKRPDIIDSNVWKPQNNLSGIDFASQRRGATSGQSVPQRQTIEIPIILDGQALDRRTVEIVDGMAQTAIDDITSNTEG